MTEGSGYGSGRPKYIRILRIRIRHTAILLTLSCFRRFRKSVLYYAAVLLQEVTIARAVELGHNANLISALSYECSKMFTTAANALSTLGMSKKIWIRKILFGTFCLASFGKYTYPKKLKDRSCSYVNSGFRIRKIFQGTQLTKLDQSTLGLVLITSFLFIPRLVKLA
jgi:hypothetical protein